MATAWETFPVKFDGGWRTDLGRLEHGLSFPGSASILQNYEPSIEGGYAKIKGYQKYSDTGVTGSGDIVGVIVTDLAGCLARRGDTYYYSTGTTWASKGTVAISGSIRTNHARYNFDGDEKIIIVDGFDDPAIFDVTLSTLTFDTSAPASVTGASLVVKHSDHLFFSKGHLLTFTAPYTDTDYDSGNGAGQINVGSDITEMIVFRDELIIFTEQSIYRLSGARASDFSLNTIAEDTGCLSANTAAEVGGDIMYLGPDGVRWLSATARNNDFGLDRASAKIQSALIQSVGPNTIYNAIVVRGKSQYRLFTNKSGVPRHLSVGYLATKFSGQDVTDISWAKMVGIKPYASDSHQFPSTERILFSSDDDYIYVMESSNAFDGEPIQSIFQTPYMPINDPRIRKTFYKHSLYMTTYGNLGFTVQNRLDYNDTSIIQPPSFEVGYIGVAGSLYDSAEATYGTAVYSAPLRNIFVDNIVGSGLTMALRYEDNSTNPTHILDYAIVEYRNNERR